MAKKQSGISELAKASQHRLDDAQALLAARRWRGAMYLAGYAVECSLKIKLMRRHRCHTLQQLDELLRRKRRIALSSSLFTHEIIVLIELLGCRDRMHADQSLWRDFNIINRWSSGWRYSPDPGTQQAASGFLLAVEATLRWIEANT